MSGQAPPAITRIPAQPMSLRALLVDAAFHARNMARSLEQAAAIAQTARGERRLAGLARLAGGWPARLDPETHERREQRRRTRNRTKPSGKPGSHPTDNGLPAVNRHARAQVSLPARACPDRPPARA